MMREEINQMKTLLLIPIFILFSLSSANAQNTFWMGDPPNQKIRQNQASEWLNCFKKVEEQIPTLSPSERTWLETEVNNELAKGKYTQRALTAMESREYHIYITRPHLEKIINNLTLLANSKSLERNREMVTWSFLANQFMDGTFWRSISSLVDRKIVNEKICYLHEQKSVYFEGFVMQAQVIIRRVIINHLN
jgi:hypothetical protein